VGSSPAEALLSILKRRRPPRPTDQAFTDGLWALTQRCWNQEAHLRPRVSEVSEVLRCLLVSSLEPPVCLPDQFLMCSDIPAWRRLISCSHTTDERISLVTEIFSDSNEIRVVKCLREDDAQVFIDMIDKVPPSFLSRIPRLTSTQTFVPR